MIMHIYLNILSVTAFLAHSITCLPTQCMDGYIQRSVWTKKRHQYICCKMLTENCPKGYHVVKCTKDLDDDTCQKCPDGKYLADHTNSTNIHSCVLYSCSSESKRVDYLPKWGCNKPCICDTELKFYGFDSCNCLPFEAECEQGTVLALNGSCLNRSDAEVLEKSTRPEEGTINIPIPEGNSPKDNTTASIPNPEFYFTTKRWIIGVGITAALVVFFLLCICVCKKCCYGNTPSSENLSINVESEVPKTALDMEKKSLNSSINSDSGISLQQTDSSRSSPAEARHKLVATVKPYRTDDVTCSEPLLRQEVDDNYSQQMPQSSSSIGLVLLNRPHADHQVTDDTRNLSHTDLRLTYNVQNTQETENSQNSVYVQPSLLHHTFPSLPSSDML